MMFGLAATARLAVAAAYVYAGSWELLPLREPYRQYAGTDGHLQIARTLWETGEYAYRPGGPPVHNRPPLPPALMYAVCAWSTEHWYVYWFLATTLLGAGTTYFAVRAMEICGADRRQTLIWGTVVAFHPFLLSATRSTSFMPTGLFVISVVHYAFCRWTMRGYRRTDGIRMGLALGAAALTHGVMILLAGAAWVAAATDRRASLAVRRRAVVVTAVVAGIVVLPWTLRNYAVFGRWIPVASGAGIQYWLKKAALTQQPDLEKQVFFLATGREPEIEYYGAVRLDDESIFFRLALRDVGNGLTLLPKGLFYFFAPPENGPVRMALAGTSNVVLLFFAFRGLKTKTFAVGLWTVCVTTGLALTFSTLAGHASYFTLLVPLWATVGATGFFRRFAV